MGKVITGIGKAVKGIGNAVGGIFSKPSMPTQAAPEAADVPAPAAAPAATPTTSGPDVVTEAATRIFRKGKKAVTVSRTTGGGVGLNV